jgi:hypothetical protein
VGLLQHGHDAKLLQEMKKIIQQGTFVEPVDPIHHWFTVQTPCDPRIIAAGDLPAQPFRQMPGDLVMCLSHGPPPSVQCLMPIEESAPQIKACAYVGISV